MDKLLKKENLDLKLTPYHVLATSATHGLVQFIPSKPIATIISEEGGIQAYLRRENPSEEAPYKISKVSYNVGDLVYNVGDLVYNVGDLVYNVGDLVYNVGDLVYNVGDLVYILLLH